MDLLHPRARPADLTASFGRAEVPKSLRTRETAEAKERFATEYAAIQRRWAALRAKPEPLPLKQIVSLAGRVYQRLTATLEDEPGESPIWENFGPEYPTMKLPWAQRGQRPLLLFLLFCVQGV